MKHTLAELMLLISVAFWGSSFALTKPLLDTMGVFTFMASRFVVGGVILVLALLILGKFKPDKQQIKGGIITGVLLFLAFIFHTYGLKYTTVAKNAFIVGSNVIFVPIILTLIMKKAQSKIVWLSTSIALVGLALITLDGAQGGLNIGDLITVIGTVIVAFYILRVEAYVKQGNPLNIATIQVLTVGLLSLIPAFIFESPIADLSIQTLTPLMIRNLLILSIGCTSIAYLLANYAQSIVSASRTALLYVFEPLFGAFLGWLILGEVVGIQGIIGALLITFATIMPQFTKKKP
ncbi:MAG TPA: DMT family transporter [Fusibacter sp.]|nr:DMT family transporter [Fusibacter sp.]